MNIMVWDRSVADYPRLTGETTDEKRIMRAVQDCERGVLYFPAGVYEIADMLTVKNCCSFLLHKSAVLKADYSSAAERPVRCSLSTLSGVC